MIKSWIQTNLIYLLSAVIVALSLFIVYLEFSSYLDANTIKSLNEKLTTSYAQINAEKANKEVIAVNREELKSALEDQNDEIEKMRQNITEQRTRISNLQYKLNTDLTAQRNSLKDMNLSEQCKSIMNDMDILYGRTK